MMFEIPLDIALTGETSAESDSAAASASGSGTFVNFDFQRNHEDSFCSVPQQRTI